MQDIAIDLLGPLPPGDLENILVIVDYYRLLITSFLRSGHYEVNHDAKDNRSADTDILMWYGYPFKSDNGAQFI